MLLPESWKEEEIPHDGLAPALAVLSENVARFRVYVAMSSARKGLRQRWILENSYALNERE